MKWNDFKVSKKLTIGFASILILTVLIGIFNFTGFQSLNKTSTKRNEIGTILSDFIYVRLNARVYIDKYTEQSVQDAYKTLEKILKNSQTLYSQFSDAAHKELAQQVINGINEYKNGLDDVVVITNKKIDALKKLDETGARSNEEAKNENIQGKSYLAFVESRVFANRAVRSSSDEDFSTWRQKFDLASTTIRKEYSGALDASLTSYQKAMEEYFAAQSELKAIEQKQVEAGNMAKNAADKLVLSMDNQQTAEFQSTIIKSVALIIAAIVIGIILSIAIAKSITLVVDSTGVVLEKIAKGDLTIEIDKKQMERGDELGTLSKLISSMVSQLREITSSIIIGTENIAKAADQLSATSQELSQGSNEQASSAEEVSSSMEEMVSNIQQNSDNSQQTEKISIKAQQGIIDVSDKSNKAVEANRIIADKIKIINDIAFQTNILALNAAVEAARAGEHGRGFAVVAAEVRKLAERSKSAADEIVTLAQSSHEMAESAGNLLMQIVPDIEKTTKLVQEIAAASMEQNSGSEQINNALQQLNQVIQQNAAASEEMASSSEELSSQSEQLRQVISFFKVDSNVKSSWHETEKHTVHSPKTLKAKPTATIKSGNSILHEKSTATGGVKLKLGGEDHAYENF